VPTREKIVVKRCASSTEMKTPGGLGAILIVSLGTREPFLYCLLLIRAIPSRNDMKRLPDFNRQLDRAALYSPSALREPSQSRADSPQAQQSMEIRQRSLKQDSNAPKVR